MLTREEQNYIMNQPIKKINYGNNNKSKTQLGRNNYY